jgi:hypothetical protein
MLIKWGGPSCFKGRFKPGWHFTLPQPKLKQQAGTSGPAG